MESEIFSAVRFFQVRTTRGLAKNILRASLLTIFSFLDCI